MTWEGSEPEVVIFASPEGEAETVYREALRIKKLLDKPASEIATGQIKYEERKQE